MAMVNRKMVIRRRGTALFGYVLILGAIGGCVAGWRSGGPLIDRMIYVGLAWMVVPVSWLVTISPRIIVSSPYIRIVNFFTVVDVPVSIADRVEEGPDGTILTLREGGSVALSALSGSLLDDMLGNYPRRKLRRAIRDLREDTALVDNNESVPAAVTTRVRIAAIAVVVFFLVFPFVLMAISDMRYEA
jgi:hypothetical protein